MKHVVIGTAGHVDHGKTSLIKAITGIDTDRLKEEKERGISIELGFAPLFLADGRLVGVVDVPGHERFIKNMVAGASGIDVVLLVIAADEGVMPQTREHVHICSLLGIRKGVVAITKIDLVDDEWIEIVRDDICEFLKDTFLNAAPIVNVSSTTGIGLGQLLNALGHVIDNIKKERDSGIFRLSADRVFTIKGFGTVVTGTITSGIATVGDDVEILPGGRIAKIRGIQIHNKTAHFAEAGQRAAINLQGVEKSAIMRGYTLSKPEIFRETKRIDVFLDYLPSNIKRLKNRALVRLHLGTSEVIARLIMINCDEIEPGKSAGAQIILESPIVAMAGDRFVIRSYSPTTTIGGGIIIDPLPKKHKRNSENVRQEFDSLCRGTDSERVNVIVARAGIKGIEINDLIVRTGIDASSLKKILDDMCEHGKIVRIESDVNLILSHSFYNDLQNKILSAVESYHKKFPLKEGILKEELRNVVGQFINLKIFTLALKNLENGKKIILNKDIVRLLAHQVNLKGELDDIGKQIVSQYLQYGLTPPTLKELLTNYVNQKDRVTQIFRVMVKEGIIIKISDDLYYHRDVLSELKENYRNLLLKEGKATPGSFKELTGLTRKFVIPLMEYFDKTKFTIRTGEHRILREKDIRRDHGT